MKIATILSIVAVGSAMISMSSTAAAHGPRTQLHAAAKTPATAASAPRANVVHAAGPRGTILVVEGGPERLAAADAIDCIGHRAGPRHTVCL